MLQVNFKAAEELGFSEKHYVALIKLLGMLERGELEWTHPNDPKPNGFNMKTCFLRDLPVYRENPECGTVGCIIGWVAFLAGDDDLNSLTRGMNASQYMRWERLTHPAGYWTGKHMVEEAAVALRSYLVTGRPDWGDCWSITMIDFAYTM